MTSLVSSSCVLCRCFLCAALQGHFVMLKGRPCKVADVSTSKTGKHGHAKVIFLLFTWVLWHRVCRFGPPSFAQTVGAWTLSVFVCEYVCVLCMYIYVCMTVQNCLVPSDCACSHLWRVVVSVTWEIANASCCASGTKMRTSDQCNGVDVLCCLIQANIMGYDIFTNKKYEDVCPTSHNIDSPVSASILSTRQEMTLSDHFPSWIPSLLFFDWGSVPSLFIPSIP